MALIEPLDLKTIFIRDVAGSVEIFSFLALLLLSYGMVKFKFSNKVVLSLFALFAVIMAAYMQPLYVLIIILAGIATYYSLTKFVR